MEPSEKEKFTGPTEAVDRLISEAFKEEVVSYVQIKRAAICWHRLTAHLQYVRYQNIMYRLFGQAERKIICIIITMLTTIRR